MKRKIYQRIGLTGAALLLAGLVWVMRPTAERLPSLAPDAAAPAMALPAPAKAVPALIEFTNWLREPELQVATVVQVPLADDTSLTGTVSEVQTLPLGTRSITVRLDNHAYSRAFIAQTDGVTSGIVRDYADNREYRLHMAVDGMVQVDAVDPNRPSLPCGCCAGLIHADAATTQPEPAVLDAEAAEVATAQPRGKRRINIDGPLRTLSGETPSSSGDIPTDIVTLSVLVVHSPAAVTAAGSQAALDNRISNALSIANDVHANSITYTQLSLAHREEVAFVEENPEDFDSPVRYLSQLTNPADGILDSVHALRATHQADFVVLVVDTDEVSGIANRPVNFHSPDKAFSVVSATELDQAFTFVHEIAHNMGIGHSKSQPDAPYTSTAFFPYAAGWQWDDAGAGPGKDGYCTVMTYEEWDLWPDPDRNYVRVPHFSNPDVSFNGIPTGDPADGNAARVIRMGRFQFSGYGGSPQIRPGSVTRFPTYIDFEDYLAFFHPAADNQIRWNLQKDNTLLPNTGPTAAHSGDYYFYAGATNSSEHNKQASLEVDVDLSGTQNGSIGFHYHMRETGDTNHMGSLFVEVSTDAGSNWSTPLWSRSGHQGDDWLPASVDLAAYSGAPLRLRFRALTGSGNNSDIALDTITITAQTLADLSVSASGFTESSLNDGSIAAPVIISVSGDSFAADIVSANRVSAANVPSGLSGLFSRLNDTQLQLDLEGNAFAHETADDIANLTVSFAAGAFTGADAAQPLLFSVSFANPSFASFVLNEYPELSDPAWDADPDKDGIINFEEYAFGMDLASVDRDQYPQFEYIQATASYQITFLRARSSVRYEVLVHDTMSDWDISASIVWDSADDPPGLVPVGDTQMVEILAHPTDARFFRVRVSE